MLTRRLSPTVKLVGPVISCEGAPFKGQSNDKWKLNPAVQSYAVAMDQVRAAVVPEIFQVSSVLARYD